MSDDNDEVQYGVLMPFVVTKTVGGPYDDEAYSAGWEMGVLDVRLEVHRTIPRDVMIHTENVPQADLLAMKHGFTMESHPVEGYSEWTHVTFIPTETIRP